MEMMIVTLLYPVVILVYSWSCGLLVEKMAERRGLKTDHAFLIGVLFQIFAVLMLLMLRKDLSQDRKS